MNHSIQRPLIECNIHRLRRNGTHVTHVANLPFHLRLIRMSSLHQIDHHAREIDAGLIHIAPSEEVVWNRLVGVCISNFLVKCVEQRGRWTGSFSPISNRIQTRRNTRHAKQKKKKSENVHYPHSLNAVSSPLSPLLPLR
jgi:hypothetical protein